MGGVTVMVVHVSGVKDADHGVGDKALHSVDDGMVEQRGSSGIVALGRGHGGAVAASTRVMTAASSGGRGGWRLEVSRFGMSW